MFNLILDGSQGDGSQGPMKQMKAYEMNLKQPQNEIRLGPKLTPISKRNTTKEKHKRGGHLHPKKKKLMRLTRR